MEPSRIHELNKIAGEFCGKLLTGQLSYGNEKWVYAIYEDECTIKYTQWNPCENHEQAAEVKEKLKEEGRSYALGWDREIRKYIAIIQTGEISEDKVIECRNEESEPIALMLAIEALTKEQS